MFLRAVFFQVPSTYLPMAVSIRWWMVAASVLARMIDRATRGLRLKPISQPDPNLYLFPLIWFIVIVRPHCSSRNTIISRARLSNCFLVISPRCAVMYVAFISSLTYCTRWYSPPKKETCSSSIYSKYFPFAPSYDSYKLNSN